MTDSRELVRSLFGAILLDTSILPDVTRTIGPDDIEHDADRRIFAIMQALDDRGEPWDSVTLFEECLARDIEQHGGATHVLGLATAAPSSLAWVSYARLLARASLERRARMACLRCLETLKTGTEPAKALSSLDTELLGLRRPDAGRDGWVSAGDTAAVILDDYADRERDGVHAIGERSGFVELDSLIGGFVRKDLVVLGGRPSMGKTSLALGCALNIAQRGGAVGIFSMEMARDALVRRLISNLARVNMTRLLRVQLTPDERRRMVDATRALAALPIHIDERGALPLAELRQRARRLANSAPNLRLLVVDYLQLAHGARGRGQSREQEVAELSMGLKVIARELDVPVLALAQLNRSLEGRPVKERRPMCSDLRDSGQIEQDADVVLFMFREEVYDPTTVDKGVAEVIVAKQRNGALGTARLAWNPEEQRFTNLECREAPPEYRSDWHAGSDA